MSSRGELIIGRKSLMVFLGYENWSAVLALIERNNCPIGKLGGRWVARREMLVGWIDSCVSSGVASKSVQIRTNWNSRTENRKSLARRRLMEEFLCAYRESGRVLKTCREVGISPQTYYNWRRGYERFDTAISQIEKDIFGNDNEEENSCC